MNLQKVIDKYFESRIICDTVIVITSIIHISNPQIENVFTPEQRLQQTIEQLESLKQIDKKMTIIVAELSLSLSEKEKEELKKRCDYLFLINDKLAIEYAHTKAHFNKSKGEIYALLSILERVECNHFIKFGGRYKIDSDFNIYTFLQDRPVASYLEIARQFFGILFSIPKKYLDTFKKHVKHMLNESFITTEKMLTNFMLETQGYNIEKLNITGYSAVDGFYHVKL